MLDSLRELGIGIIRKKKMKTKLTWVEYYFGHCLQTGWLEIGNNFRMWSDLMTGNYANYSLRSDDDPYEECNSWFWISINSDETFPREYLERLLEMMDRSEEELIPLSDWMRPSSKK